MGTNQYTRRQVFQQRLLRPHQYGGAIAGWFAAGPYANAC